MSRREILDGSATLWMRLLHHGIGLEKVFMKDETSHGFYVLAIIGKARVANLHYEKRLFARVTFDNWASHQDYVGAWMETSQDGRHDVFSFGFTRRERSAVDVQFAICCVQGGRQYWDNNDGMNYKLHLEENPFSR